MKREKPVRGEGAGDRQRARVFWSGRSQAVRLPKAFRFSTAEVAIRREGRAIVIEPIEIARDDRGWPEAWWDLGGAAPEFDVGDRRAPHERTSVLSSHR